MIYIANGIYSDASPNEYLAHYGVLGMKWGVRKARQHERNLYRYNMRNGMSKADAKARYRSNMEGVKQYAKANRHSGIKARDIANASYRRANSKIANYDKVLKKQRNRKIAAGVGAAALATAAGIGAYKYAKGHSKSAIQRNNFEAKRNMRRAGISVFEPDRISPNFLDKNTRSPNRQTRNKFYKMSGTPKQYTPKQYTPKQYTPKQYTPNKSSGKTLKDSMNSIGKSLNDIESKNPGFKEDLLRKFKYM